jgi:hypothetical protein
MTKQRVKALMQRVGVEDLPLAHCQTVGQFSDALTKLSDAELLSAWARTLGVAASRLSDDELLRELDKTRQEDS